MWKPMQTKRSLSNYAQTVSPTTKSHKSLPSQNQPSSNGGHKEISNRIFLNFETLLSKYNLKKKARIESLAIVLHNVMEELKSRPLEELSTKDLLSLIQQLDSKMRQEVAPLQYFTGEYINIADDLLLDIGGKEVALPFAY